MMPALRIISWGHRRATEPLIAAREAFQAYRGDIEVAIDIRPLSDFEHQGIASVANHYDLVVFDHPFSGDIASAEVFLPLDEHLPDLLGPEAAGLYVGPSLDSYRFAGHVWGAPIDAATQHALVRPDLLQAAGEKVPSNWCQTLTLGRRLAKNGVKLGIAVETPHALLSIGSLMANAGRPWTTDPTVPLVIDSEAFLTAYRYLQDLLVLCPPEALGWNSIDLHEAMVARDDIAYCPAVYGYATYGEADQRRPLAFGAFAGTCVPYAAGSAIGGTALGVSSRSREPEAALAFVRHMLGAEIQDHLIPGHHGQPALLSSWLEPANDRRFNGFYSSALSSLRTAWVRPRRAGYPVFQQDAGRVVAEALRAGADGRRAADQVIELALKL
jgi:multiple sugar transport system substrate-binding protein